MLINLKTQLLPPIGIIGLGLSGLSAKHLLLASGFGPNDIFTFDEKSTEADFTNRDQVLNRILPKTIIVSPGFPLSDPLIKIWRDQGALVTSEINLACSFLTDEKIIGITGSLGKSTTTSLIGAGLKSIDRNSFVGGNLGTPFCEYALSLIQNPQNKANWIVLELSSYQLENSEKLKLDYSIITYLTPNHLERYHHLFHYYETKWHIQSLTKNKMILNTHGGDLKSFASTKNLSNVIWSDPHDHHIKLFSPEEAVILGKHNQDNLALAINLVLAAEIPKSCIEEIKKFSGLSHRLEVLGSCEGLLFINDSKATTIESVETAIESCLFKKNYQRVVVLLGGKDKKLPWPKLRPKLMNKKIFPLFFGESGSNIKAQLLVDGPCYPSLSELLKNLNSLIHKGDVVLLSPGGTSYDEFKNFEERGEFFKNWVKTNYPI